MGGEGVAKQERERRRRGGVDFAHQVDATQPKDAGAPVDGRPRLRPEAARLRVAKRLDRDARKGSERLFGEPCCDAGLLESFAEKHRFLPSRVDAPPARFGAVWIEAHVATLATGRYSKRMVKIEDVRKLVAAHRKLDEPLSAAIYVATPEQPNEVCLVEILSELEDDRAEEATYFNPGITFRFPLRLYAADAQSLKNALRRDSSFATLVAAGEVVFEDKKKLGTDLIKFALGKAPKANVHELREPIQRPARKAAAAKVTVKQKAAR